MTERELQHLYGEDYAPQSEETKTALIFEEEGEDIKYILTGTRRNWNE